MAVVAELNNRSTDITIIFPVVVAEFANCKIKYVRRQCNVVDHEHASSAPLMLGSIQSSLIVTNHGKS